MSAIKSIPYLKFPRQRLIAIRKITISCCLLFFLFLITSCDSFIVNVTSTPQATLETSLMDRSILTDSPCSAPCWYGLRLGKSTEADVLAILQSLSFVDPTTIQEQDVGYWDSSRRENIKAKLISVKCKEPAGHQCVGLTVANDTLRSIGLFPNYTITFQEIVDHLGSPDYVRVGLIPPGNTCKMSLIWVHRQIITDYSDHSSNKLCFEIRSGKAVEPTLIAQSITYVLPDDGYLASIPDPGYDYSWPGFIKP